MSITFVPIPNTFRCELIYLMNGQFIENVYHVKSGGGVTVGDANRIAGKLAAWWTGSQRGQMASTCTLQRIEVVDASQVGGVGIIYTTGLPQNGALAASPYPNNVTLAVKWSTGLVGRSYRGRTFICGLPSGSTTGNQVTTVYQGIFQTIYTALITGLQGGGTVDNLVVASKRSNNAWRTTGVATIITACAVDINLDSQRRRLTGSGRGT